jgi:hypothetical protein
MKNDAFCKLRTNSAIVIRECCACLQLAVIAMRARTHTHTHTHKNRPVNVLQVSTLTHTGFHTNSYRSFKSRKQAYCLNSEGNCSLENVRISQETQDNSFYVK